MELAKAVDIPPFDKLKLALIGTEKSGKSRLAVTGRKPILVCDFDQRRESIAGTPGVYIATFRDRGHPYQPEAFGELLDLLTKLETNLDLLKCGFDVLEGTILKTIVLDSISTLAQAAMSYALYTTKEIRREINIGGKITVQIPKSYDAWGAEMSMVTGVLFRVLALPIDVIITLHETAEESPDSSNESPKFTGRIDVFPVRYKRLLKYFNELWRVSRDTGTVPKVIIAPDWKFTTATCLDLDGVETPNIEAMIAKHISRHKGDIIVSNKK